MRRTGIAGGLLAAVVTWVALLSLLSPTSSTNSHKIVPAADGSRCIIKFIDKSNFSAKSTPGQVTLRMDLLDGAGKPIVNLKDTDFTVIEENLPGRVTAFRGPQSQVINVILVIDVSGSMSQDNRIEGARKSAKTVIEVLKVDRDRIAIIPFWDSFSVLRPLETLTAGNRSAALSLVDSLSPRGGTRIGPPTLEGLTLYKQQAPDGAKMVLVMTDGEDPSFANHIKEIEKLADDIGAQVHTIGFGTEVGPQARMALEEVARGSSGQYQHAPTNEELARIFNARVQETINECTLTYDSPYPQPDGLPRKVRLEVKTPNGVLNGGFTYQVGPILGGRSSPAAWAITTGAAPVVSGVFSVFMSVILFLTLAVTLVAGLAIPEFIRGKGAHHGAASSTAPVPLTVNASGVTGPTKLPPPPVRPTPHSTPAVSLSATTNTGGQIQAPVQTAKHSLPLPPPPKPKV